MPGHRCIWRHIVGWPAPPARAGTCMSGGPHPPPANSPPACAARRWRIGGRVQGVGFRPFVYRLAHHYELHGWVRNSGGTVEIHAQGVAERLRLFGRSAAEPRAARGAGAAARRATHVNRVERGIPHSGERPRPGSASPCPLPISTRAMSVWRSFAIRPQDAIDTRSSTARSADRATRSFARCLRSPQYDPRLLHAVP
jgi:acylphosphatase